MSTTSTKIALRAAIAQLRSTNSKHSNLINVAKCAGMAKCAGAQMLFLPECLGFMGDNAEHTLQNADPPITELIAIQSKMNDGSSSLDTTTESSLLFRTEISRAIADGSQEIDVGDDIIDYTNYGGDKNESRAIKSIITELCYIAKESNLWISGGGVHTKVPQSDFDNNDDDTNKHNKIYNTHVIINNRGHIKAHYHKIHLFDVSIPNKVNLRESNTTCPGTNLVVCDTPIGRLGLSICYDMRFPEMYVTLVQEMGAEILLMPSAFTVPTGKAHWHALLKARAIESQCYVLAAAQVGQHNEKRQSYGHSLAYDSWGELLADAGGYDGPGMVDLITNHPSSTSSQSDESAVSPVRVPSIITTDIDLEHLKSMRERMPIQQHRDNSNFS